MIPAEGKLSMTPADREFLKDLGRQIFAKMKRDNDLRRIFPDDDKIRGDVDTMVSVDYQHYKLKLLERETGLSLYGRKLLEIGSGTGFFVIVARAAGIEAQGLEPYTNVYEEDRRFAESLFSHFRMDPGLIRREFAEKMSFPDDTFDAVFSYYAFEHVDDPLAVLKESLRVLKPGGTLHFVFPNYGSLWECHYAVPWIPGMKRGWGRRYVRWLWGRSPAMIDHINFLNEKDVLSILDQVRDTADVVSLGREVFEREIPSLSFDATGSIRRVMWVFKLLKATGLLRAFAWTLSRLGLYTPFYMTLRKRPSP